jgi:LysM repeat protein
VKIHIVKKGDTLYELSKKYNVDLEKLIAANPHIADPNVIDVGMKVKIPTSPVSVQPPADYLYKHVVVQGDTLWKLGKAWGIPLNEMIAANPQLKNPNVLMTGEIVYIPKLQKEQHNKKEESNVGIMPQATPQEYVPMSVTGKENVPGHTLPAAPEQEGFYKMPLPMNDAHETAPSVPPFEQFHIPAVEVSVHEEKVNIYEQKGPAEEHMYPGIDPIQWTSPELPHMQQMPSIETAPLYSNVSPYPPVFPTMPGIEHHAAKADCGCGGPSHADIMNMYAMNPGMSSGYTEPVYYPYDQTYAQWPGFPRTDGQYASFYPGIALPVYSTPLHWPNDVTQAHVSQQEDVTNKQEPFGDDGTIAKVSRKTDSRAASETASVRKKNKPDAKAAVRNLVNKKRKKKPERSRQDNIPWIGR